LAGVIAVGAVGEMANVNHVFATPDTAAIIPNARQSKSRFAPCASGASHVRSTMTGASPIARCKPTQYLFIEIFYQPSRSDQWIRGAVATLMFGVGNQPKKAGLVVFSATFPR